MHRSNDRGSTTNFGATCIRRTHRTFELLQFWTKSIGFPSRNTLFDPGSDRLLGLDVHLCPGVPLLQSHKFPFLSPPSWLPSWCLRPRWSGTSPHPSTVEICFSYLSCHTKTFYCVGCSVWRLHSMSCSHDIGEGKLKWKHFCGLNWSGQKNFSGWP